MINQRIYRENVNLKEVVGKVIEIKESTFEGDSKYLDILIDPILFFPEGGGQPCDLGELITEEKKPRVFKVVNCYEDEEKKAWLSIERENEKDVKLEMSLIQRLDWERRFDNMQRHAGEHILSGSFHALYGGVNRGFHMGEDYMTIDISLEDNPKYKEMTKEMINEVELYANKIIWQDLPIKTFYFEERKEAEKMKLRKALAFDEDISIVCMGNPDEPADCCACCGTHPSSTGQIGLIKVYKMEVNKGMYRIYCDAGKRAYANFQFKHDLLTKLGQKYSAVPETLLEKIADSDKKNQAIRDQLYALKKIYIAEQAEAIKNEIVSCEGPLYAKEIVGLPLDDILQIGRPLLDSLEKLLILVDRASLTLLLFSNGKKIDCGKLVKENVGIYNGKGGGSPQNARAIFSKDDYLDTFIDLLRNHLR